MCWYMNCSKQGKSNGGERGQMKQMERQRKERKENKSGMAANGRDEDNSKTRGTGKHGARVASAEGGPGNADRTTQTPHGLYLHSPLCFRKDIIVQG